MGYGDVLMTMGEARRLHEQNPGKTICLPRREHPELYADIGYLTDNPTRAQLHLTDTHPATDRAKTTQQKIAFKNYRPYPAELKLPQIDLSRFGDYVFIEPHTKTMTSANNRNWGWENFCAVVKRVPFRFVQPFYGPRVLPGVERILTKTFLDAVAVLKGARTGLMAEGGMMHAAAAVRTPSVIIFGGFISPQNTGYDMHSNLFVGGEPCGHRFPCPHCREAMKQITVDQVVEALSRKLAEAGHTHVVA